jgi:hypothetical protein
LYFIRRHGRNPFALNDGKQYTFRAMLSREPWPSGLRSFFRKERVRRRSFQKRPYTSLYSKMSIWKILEKSRKNSKIRECGPLRGKEWKPTVLGFPLKGQKQKKRGVRRNVHPSESERIQLARMQKHQAIEPQRPIYYGRNPDTDP